MEAMTENQKMAVWNRCKDADYKCGDISKKISAIAHSFLEEELNDLDEIAEFLAQLEKALSQAENLTISLLASKS